MIPKRHELTRSRPIRCVLAGTLGFAMLLPGCGDDAEMAGEAVDTHPVTGVVTLNGRPVADAHVTFHPGTDAPAAFAKTNQEGEYSLQTYEPDDGAPLGEYKVTVQKMTGQEVPQMSGEEWFKEMEKQAQSGGPPLAPEGPKSAVPEKYSTPATTDLTATITAGDNKIDLKLVP